MLRSGTKAVRRRRPTADALLRLALCLIVLLLHRPAESQIIGPTQYAAGLAQAQMGQEKQAALSGELADPRESPYFASPLLRQAMDWATMQLTFDGGSVMPDMALALGERPPQVQGTLHFEPGVRGLALRVGDGGAAVVYPRGANATLDTQGAIALWICPLGWTHTVGGNTTFVMTTNASFYIQRQGPWIEGLVVKRHEGLQCLLFSPSVGRACLMFGTQDFPLQRWRLVVANWAWPSVSFSLDGGNWQSATVKGRPPAEEFGELLIGATGGEPTLLDEIIFFRRPLTEAEVKALYEALRPAAAL